MKTDTKSSGPPLKKWPVEMKISKKWGEKDAKYAQILINSTLRTDGDYTLTRRARVIELRRVHFLETRITESVPEQEDIGYLVYKLKDMNEQPACGIIFARFTITGNSIEMFQECMSESTCECRYCHYTMQDLKKKLIKINKRLGRRCIAIK